MPPANLLLPAPAAWFGLQMTEDAYASMVATENANRLAEEENAARSVAEALSVLGVKEAAEVDKHPEK